MKKVYWERMFLLLIGIMLIIGSPASASNFYPTDVNIIENGKVWHGEQSPDFDDQSEVVNRANPSFRIKKQTL